MGLTRVARACVVVLTMASSSFLGAVTNFSSSLSRIKTNVGGSLYCTALGGGTIDASAGQIVNPTAGVSQVTVTNADIYDQSGNSLKIPTSAQVDFSNYSLYLTGGGSRAYADGPIVTTLDVTGTNNTFSGYLSAASLVHLGSGSTLNFAPTTAVGGNIQVAGSASITANSDILFRGGNFFTPDGTGVTVNLDLNHYRLGFGGVPLTTNSEVTLNVSNADDLYLTGDMVLDSTMTISSDTIINGNGHTITIGTNGQFNVQSGAKLYLIDVNLFNVGANTFVMADDTCEIHFGHSTVVLGGNLTTDAGTVIIDSESVWYLPGYSWTFTDNAGAGTSGKLQVCNAVLWVDEMAASLSAGTSPIDLIIDGTGSSIVKEGTCGGTFQYGTIKEIAAFPEDLNEIWDYIKFIHGNGNYTLKDFSASIWSYDSVTGNADLRVSAWLGDVHSFIFDTNMNVNGHGYSLYFDPAGSANQLQLTLDAASNPITVNLSDIALRQFDPARVYFDAGCTLNFGDGTVIEYADGVVQNFDTTVSGTVTMTANGGSFALNSGTVTVSAGATLHIVDADVLLDPSKLVLNATDADGPANLILENCRIFLTGAWNITKANVEIRGEVEIDGVSGTVMTFDPSNSGLSAEADINAMNFTVAANAVLHLMRSITFAYRPFVATADPAQTTGSQVVINAAGVFWLDGAGFSTLANINDPTQGVDINTGMLLVDDRSPFNLAVPLTIATAAILAIRSAGVVDVTAGELHV